MRLHYEVSGFMSNPDKSIDQNVVSHFRNLLAGTISENPILPRMIILVPDGDIVNYYGFKGFGASRGYGYIINWIMKEHNKIVEIYKELLPAKCKKAYYPQFVWIELPLHCNFPVEDREARSSFNTSLREIGKSHT